MLYPLHSIPIPEIVRYALGAKIDPIPQDFLQQAQSAADELLRVCQPQYHYLVHPVQPLLDSFLSGKDIRRHLNGCTDCVLLCATLGAQVDTLIRRTQFHDMAKALWLDAAASTAIEEVCDGVQQSISDTLQKQLTTRFSCGYGDLPLNAQAHFLSILDAHRKIGLTLSVSGMLMPIKSVTAVIGIFDDPSPCCESISPCDICHLRTICQFRRKGVFCGKQFD